MRHITLLVVWLIYGFYIGFDWGVLYRYSACRLPVA